VALPSDHRLFRQLVMPGRASLAAGTSSGAGVVWIMGSPGSIIKE